MSRSRVYRSAEESAPESDPSDYCSSCDEDEAPAAPAAPAKPARLVRSKAFNNAKELNDRSSHDHSGQSVKEEVKADEVSEVKEAKADFVSEVSEVSKAKRNILSLKKEAKERNIARYSKMNKKQLEEALGYATLQNQEEVKVEKEESSGDLNNLNDAELTAKIGKMTLAEIKTICKKVGIKMSQYNKIKSKSLAKTRSTLAKDLMEYCQSKARGA